MHKHPTCESPANGDLPGASLPLCTSTMTVPQQETLLGNSGVSSMQAIHSGEFCECVLYSVFVCDYVHVPGMFVYFWKNTCIHTISYTIQHICMYTHT